ncbi:hypothetical protein EDB81DRAFT_813355 [Dactylonectria macrodidyma]|uniref:Uncharacterized protein n=1 Tax=Dactylonectria macrodidyma TaxID=307937 RepID=A0A9P9IKX6_9HYPO|nr:hypothetical protein EDB81DRAFT_813355 [Dactylonectria macrodidyma]
MICYGVGIAFSFILRFYLARENRRRDCDSPVQATQDSTELGGNVAAMLDKTDIEITQLRYV